MKTFITVILVCLLVPFSFAQDNLKMDIEAPAVISPWNGNLDVGNLNSQKETVDAAKLQKIEELSKQLQSARKNGNSTAAESLIKQINELSGNESYSGQNYSLPQPVLDYEGSGEEVDIGLTVVASGFQWSFGLATDPVTGNIFMVNTDDELTDTLKLLKSTNGGITWTLLTRLSFGAAGIEYRNDELDIELLRNATDPYIYITASFTFGTPAKDFVYVARWNVATTATEFFFGYIDGGGGTNNRYWPRIVSDYPRWTSGAFVYIVNTLDSVFTGGHSLYSRYQVITSPFVATPTITNRNNAFAGYAYTWSYTSAPTDAILRTDVGYIDSLGNDKILTVNNFMGTPFADTLYFSYSNDYGATTPSTRILNATYNCSTPKLAFNQGLNQLTGGVLVVRDFDNGGDLDPYWFRTTNAGLTWTGGYVDSSTDTTFNCDVIPLKGIEGQAKFTWTNRNAPDPEQLYRSQYGTSLSPIVRIDPVNLSPSTFFAPGRAGYRLGFADSCLALWSGPTGTAGYVTSGCSGVIVNINDPVFTPYTFSLSQNYPNPFNPTTSISFSIAKNGMVRLVIYDILGKEVATLINEQREAGDHIFDFNANHLSSGVYFYKLVSGDFEAVKTMILLK